MDLNPLITPSNVLTDALNATIITNNGNEGVLQNDMGNGRVETAYLPEGYIPVGSCEFGDIIYIASYNPFIDKCLLGCFPSPQRNISSSLTSDLKQNIDENDFQDLHLETGESNGKLKSFSLKKIVYENNLTSGDKYIICAEGISNEQYLSDLGNTNHNIEDFPRLYKIKIVSIEEDGKITELSSGLKWYENSIKDNISKEYFLLDENIDRREDNSTKIDIDEWRSAVSSAYSIFSSKVSGKLALLIELESITGFSCTWGVAKSNTEMLDSSIVEGELATPDLVYGELRDDLIFQEYPIYFSINWDTDNNNINPSGIILTEQQWLNSPTIGYYDSESGEIIKNGFTYDNGNLPKVWDQTNYGDSGDAYAEPISRLYKPEETISYEDFKNEFEYEIASLNHLHLKELEATSSKQLSKLLSVQIPENIDPEFGVIPDIDIQIPEDLDPNFSIKSPFKTKEIIRAEDGIKYYLNAKNFDKNENGETIYYTYDQNGERIDLNPVKLSDDVVNNTFKYPIRKHFHNFVLPVKLKISIENSEGTTENIDIDLNLSNCVYEYKVAPCMPYGVLEQFTLTGIIDFSKIGKKSIKLNTFKYYNQTGNSTFTWGLEAYCEPNHKISRVVFEFYDNQGKCAAFHVNDKDSYNGTFTNYLLFNSKGIQGLSDIDFEGNPFYHLGELVLPSEYQIGNTYYYFDTEKNKITSYIYEDAKNLPTDKLYQNDAGTLYANWLYLVKINIEYVSIGPLEQEERVDVIEDYRWFWTTQQFNDLYYQVNDFDNVNFILGFDGTLEISSTDNWVKGWVTEEKYAKTPNEFTYSEQEINPENPDSFSAIVQSEDAKENLVIKGNCGLQNDYGVFNINTGTSNNSNENTNLKYINTKIYLGEEKIINVPELPDIIFSDSTENKIYEKIYPKIFKENEENLNLNNNQESSSSNIKLLSSLQEIIQDRNVVKFEDTIDNNEWKQEIGHKIKITINPGNKTIEGPINLSTIGCKISRLLFDGSIEDTYDLIVTPFSESIKITAKSDDSFIVYGEFKKDKISPSENPPKEDEDDDREYDDEFRNKFSLKFSNDLHGYENIKYIDQNYNLVNTGNSYEYASCNFDDLTKEGIKLDFTGYHYSKYYFTTETDTKNMTVLQSFLSSESGEDDMKYYNLIKTENNEIICENALGISFHNKTRYPSRIEFILYNPIKNIHEIIDKNDCKSSNDGKKSVKSGIELFFKNGHKNDMLNANFNFLFPYIYMNALTVIYDWVDYSYIFDYGDDNKRYINYLFPYLDKNYNQITYPSASTDTGSDKYHIGGLAGFTNENDGNILLSDLYETEDYLSTVNEPVSVSSDLKDKNVFYKYGSALYSFLCRSFFFSDSKLLPYQKLKNWVYLSPNYTEYDRDIILHIELGDISEINSRYGLHKENSLIGFHKILYSSYINKILEKFDESSLKEKLGSKPIINLTIGSCQKTFPIQMRFNYIQPYLTKQNTNLYLFDCYDKELSNIVNEYLLNNNINVNFDRNIYFFNDETISKLNSSCIVNNLLPKLNNFNYLLNSNFINNLSINDLNRLQLNNYSDASGTYKVKLSKQYSLTNFDKYLYFMKIKK